MVAIKSPMVMETKAVQALNVRVMAIDFRYKGSLKRAIKLFHLLQNIRYHLRKFWCTII